MPRSKRTLSKQNQYHLISRGINKSPIFLDKKDHIVFLSILKEKSKEMDVKIHAYCLMKNHYHILAGNFNNNLSSFMKKVGESYVIYFNKKYSRIGPLFQDRFRSEPIEDEKYFLAVNRYIHQNPEKAGVANTLDYEWSSIKAYFGHSSFVETQFTLDIIGGKHNFLQFVTTKNDDVCLEYLKQDVSDEVAKNQIKSLLDITDFNEIDILSVSKRNHLLQKVKNCGYPIKQISRLTGFSVSLIKNA